MKQNFIQLDFMDISDAAVGKNIIVRFINKDGTQYVSECTNPEGDPSFVLSLP